MKQKNYSNKKNIQTKKIIPNLKNVGKIFLINK